MKQFGASAEEVKFNEMLGRDKATYANIVKIRAVLLVMEKKIKDFDAGDRTVFKYYSQRNSYAVAYENSRQAWLKLRDSYNARQNDYKTNTTQRISQWLSESADSTTKTLSNIWNSFTSLFGLGIIPLLIVPVVITTGAVISVAIVSYFVNKYYESTSVNYNEGAKLGAKIYEQDPVAGKAFMDQLNKQQTVQSDSQSKSLFSEIGTGIKILLGTIGVGVVGYGIYYISKDSKK